MLNQKAYKIRTDLDRAVMVFYWFFLFAFVFLVFTLTGSIWAILGQVLQHPEVGIQLFFFFLKNTKVNFNRPYFCC